MVRNKYGPPETAAPEVKEIWRSVLKETEAKYPLGHPTLAREAEHAGVSQEEIQKMIAHQIYIERRRTLIEKWREEYRKHEPEEEEEEEENPTIMNTIAPATIYGWLSPPLMEELKKLVELEEWPPPEEPSPIFSTVLQVCDYAFTLKVLKWKCDEMLTGKSGHKKIIIARLLNAEEEELTDIAQRTIAELEVRGLFEEEEIPLEEVTEIARKVVGI